MFKESLLLQVISLSFELGKVCSNVEIHAMPLAHLTKSCTNGMAQSIRYQHAL